MRRGKYDMWRWSAAVAAGMAVCAIAGTARAQQPAAAHALTLQRAVALAQETHPAVALARAGEAAAEAGVGVAGSEWWPKLGGGATLMSYDQDMLVAPIHGFMPSDFEQIEFAQTLIQGTLSLSWTLFDGGARGARVKGARANSAGATADREAAQQSLAAQTAVAYLQVLTARGVLDAREERIASLEAERRRVEQFLAEGRAAQVELLRVDAALAEAQAEQVSALTRLDLAERQLARLIGLPVDAALADSLRPVRLAESAALEERSALLARALAHSPEMERARQDLVSAQAGRSLAKAAWIPKLDVTGAGQAFSSTSGNVSGLWSIGVGITYPLFTGGARSQAVSQASARVDMARQRLRLEQLQIEERVDRALNSALETLALVEALDRAVQHQTEVVRIERLSLDAGAGTQTDYLRAEADLSRGRSMLVEARHAEIAARVELARLVGDLTSEWLDRNLEMAQ